MSHVYIKSVSSWNTSSVSNTASTIATLSPTAAPRSTVALPGTNISDQMREEAMDVVVVKIISLLVLTILSVLCGLLPLRLLIYTPQLFANSRSAVDYFLCCLRLFSGGVYLATCFLHLMPDTREKITAVMLNLGSRTSYAVPELLIMSGFYVVVFVEQIIQILYVKALESDGGRRQQKKVIMSKIKSNGGSYQSTLDENVNQACNHINHKITTDDEDEEYNNVLIEDEDDLSFRDNDSEEKSLDSLTQVKGNLEQPSEVDSVNVQKIEPTDLNRGNCNHVSSKQQSSQHNLVNHPKPSSYGDLSTFVLKTFSRSSFDVVSKTTGNDIKKTSANDIKPYENLGTPIIHTNTQQHYVPNSLKQNCHINKYQGNHVNHLNHSQHNHHQVRQSNHQEKPSNPCALQQQKALFQLVQTAYKDTKHNNPHQILSIPRPGPHYPAVGHSTDEESTDNEDDESSLHRTNSGTSVCVDGISNMIDDNTAEQPNTSQNRDAEVHVFPNQDCNGIDVHTPAQSSKEISFDRISGSTSSMQDIHVKRVVDELSKSDASSRAHLRSIIYIMALSFHGIFEGMALGLQSMKSSTWSLCFAIVIHRCVLAFKLGMDLCRGEEKQGTTFLCIGMFTLISTLGIIIGILISSGASLYSDVSVPEAILQSLATGTIFYIVFFDILFKDLDGKEYLKRVSCSFVGIFPNGSCVCRNEKLTLRMMY
ncbi:unnamed protein product [Candidula unifasciata]|uniref:Uncharacterized protein n=1 Tax=Candidula unifasciata TaxID=100452 RepID=A0A8S3Z710_9EUPU|nr:unnamed protein product [Candidula unifasciata]